MKIISWNVNGLRAVCKSNFLKWLKKENADFVCLQEIKIQEDRLPEDIIKIVGYYPIYNFAQKRGYSGTAIFAKQKPKLSNIKFGHKRFDDEGRFILLKYSKFILCNFYMPHGGRQKEKLGYKLEVYKKLLNYLSRNNDKKIIFVGDFNIAHEDIDLERPKQNRDNIMFTPEEKTQIDKIIQLGYIDTFRKFNQESGNYTWWPYMANARQRNLGWRIDYIFASNNLSQKVKKAFILKNVLGSDHCPIGIELII